MPVSVGAKASLNERKDFINIEKAITNSNSTNNLGPSATTQVSSTTPGVEKINELCIAKPSYSDKPDIYSVRNKTSQKPAEDPYRFTKGDNLLSSRRIFENNEENLIASKSGNKYSLVNNLTKFY